MDKIDAFRIELAELLRRHNADIDFMYEGDTHGIHDESVMVTVDGLSATLVNGSGIYASEIGDRYSVYKDRLTMRKYSCDELVSEATFQSEKLLMEEVERLRGSGQIVRLH